MCGAHARKQSTLRALSGSVSDPLRTSNEMAFLLSQGPLSCNAAKLRVLKSRLVEIFAARREQAHRVRGD